MKILYVINSLEMGGGEKLCVDLAVMAKREGITIDFYVINSVETPLINEARRQGINLYNCGTNSYKTFAHIKWLKKNMNNYDVIHSHLFYAQYYVAILRLFNKKIKLVTTEHSTFNSRRNYKFFKVLEKYIYGSYNDLIVINKQNLNALKEWQPKIADRISIIENGIDINRYKNASANEIKDEVLLKVKDKKKILMVAAFRAEKNHLFVVDAIKDMNDDYVLILVGDGYADVKQEVKEAIKKYSLEDRVIFLGNRSDVQNIIKFCDISVLPSKWEGFGLVAVEAMAGGLPVVGSNVEGLAEVIGNEDLLFEVGNKEEFTQKILSITTNQQKKEKLVNYCEKQCEKFSLDETFKKHMKIYIN